MKLNRIESLPDSISGDNIRCMLVENGSSEVLDRLITVFGGSGFIGRHIVRRLAAAGHRVRIPVRDVEAARFLKPMGDVGQVVPVAANIRDDDSVRAAVRDADVVVFSVGVLFSSGRQTFEAVHVEGAERVARAASEFGARRMVHISALGASAKSESRYAQTKAEGENRVEAAFPGASIVRPGVVFGAEDQFFNRFAAIARVSPILPIFGSGVLNAGNSLMQPVYVGDVAEAITNVIDSRETAGEIYELGGPRTYSFRAIMELIMRETGRQRLLVPVPFWAMQIPAAVLEILPKPPLTRDQLILLSVDNVVSGSMPGLKDLGINPHSVEAIVPGYLQRYRRYSNRNADT